jgi:hypothetical protein
MSLKDNSVFNEEPLHIKGSDIRPFDFIDITTGIKFIVHVERYNGPLKHLFKEGASIIYWPSSINPKKLTGMTIDHSNYYDIWRNKK